jgi:predicted dehydrogenase
VERRQFLKNITAAGAGLTAAPALLARKSPNDIVGVACIGVGTRGHQLMQEASACPNTEVRIVSDLYAPHVTRAQNLLKNPNLRIVHEWEKAVADKDIDAVVIATPDFWHAPMAIRAVEAGKDVYVEKGLCKNLKETKALRKAVEDKKAVLQLGHHYNSMSTFLKAKEIYQSGVLGKVPLIRTCIDRTSAFPEWKFYGWYTRNELPAEATRENIDWDRFQANASVKKAFDPERFFRWRCWWEYGNGIAGDLMSHLWDAANGVAGLGIPETAQVQGDLYFWKEDREVPDQWHVLFDYPKKETAFTFECVFHSRHYGEMAEFLGRDKTLEVSPHVCRTFVAEWKPEYAERLMAARKKVAANPEMGWLADEVVAPEFTQYHKGDNYQSPHMANFIECVRSRETPRCGMERAWEEGVAIAMAVEAYRRERKVRWDPVKEEIV